MADVVVGLLRTDGRETVRRVPLMAVQNPSRRSPDLVRPLKTRHNCRCSGNRGTTVHLLLGPYGAPSTISKGSLLLRSSMPSRGSQGLTTPEDSKPSRGPFRVESVLGFM
jgi:hypothetical protein